MSKTDEANIDANHHGTTSSDIPLPAPTLPEYVERAVPPPSYEEIMGHQTQTSVNSETSTADLPPLAYVDIMPRILSPGNIKNNLAPQFDKFGFLIDAANEWLRGNPGLAVWKCETVERKVEAGPKIEMDKMLIHHSTYGFNVFILGLRMWLVKKKSPAPPQQMGLMNVVPEKKVITFTRETRQMMLFDDAFYRTTRTHDYATYDGLQETITKLNSKLKANPLPGTILNVEAAMMKTFEGFSFDEVDPENTCYTSQHKMKRLTQILRIFYILGPPSGEEICLQEFHPFMTKPPTITTNALYQNWQEVMGQLGSWLANTRGIRVVNLQTFNARVRKLFDKADIMSDCTDEIQTSVGERRYVKIMRVFYTTGSQIQSQPIQSFACRLFVPIRIGHALFEGMAQTMYRIEAWLRLSGLPIYNVETIQYKMDRNRFAGVEMDKCAWTEDPNAGNFFVTAVRVYFPCAYNEPDPSRLPPQQYYDPSFSPGESGCCSVS